MGHKNVTAVSVCTDHSVNLSKPSAFPSPNKALKSVLAEKHLNFIYLGRASADRLLRSDDPNQCEARLNDPFKFNVIAKNLILKPQAL